ncbi:hypothetical protein JG688_00018377 [Phytophthora aleatoria]|uniref:Uncharacterized protein n=1 Tax=Phytophthora aleatoria TaxID=2496075 RepID=A0A8J5I2V2_9STRA|nr:hypothetical protein JG688_00018377 [Phytophthora aleatoria]
MQLNSEELVDVNKRSGYRAKKILKYIWENTFSELCMVDVHNLLAKLKREEDSGTTLSDRVSETVKGFCEDEEYGASHVDMDTVNNEIIRTLYFSPN